MEQDGKGLPYGIWKCKIKLTKPFKFKTGRADCIPDDGQKHPYIATKEENHFNPHSNAPELLQNLLEVMGMTAEDFVATAFPVHAMIEKNVFNSFSVGTKYQYLSTGPYLSNMFFKLLTERPVYGPILGGNPVGSPHFRYVHVHSKVVSKWR